MSGRVEAFLASKVLAEAKEEHGKNIVSVASEREIRKLGRIPTGVFFLDYALGGDVEDGVGFPAGRVSTVWGEKSTGKTVICVRALANAQKLCANCYTPPAVSDRGVPQCACGDYREHVCVYLDIEGTWDNKWAQLHGVDTDRMLLSKPEYAEQALDIGENFLRSGQVDFMVFDSLAALAPAKEVEGSVSQELYAEQARVLGRAMRKFGATLNYLENETGRRPTILFTNQVRLKVGQMFGNPEVQPGGKAPGFTATVEVRTLATTYEIEKVTGRPRHVDLQFKVTKNKSSVAHIQGKWRLLLMDSDKQTKGAVYEELEMVNKALEMGVVKREAPTKWVYLGDTYKSKSLIIDTMIKDAKFKKQFAMTLLSVLGCDS